MNEGNMQIETYEIEEATSGTTKETDAQSIELIEKLGLEGQKKLISPSTGERLQYPEMTTAEHNVYKAVFPVHTNIKAYEGGIIPVRVLQVAAHAADFCYDVQVWHKGNPRLDPLLVGRIGPSEYQIRKVLRLARWGDALVDYSELVKEAREIIRRRIEREQNNRIENAKTMLGRLDELVSCEVNGEPAPFVPF
jgi:hypothetical protein